MCRGMTSRAAVIRLMLGCDNSCLDGEPETGPRIQSRVRILPREGCRVSKGRAYYPRPHSDCAGSVGSSPGGRSQPPDAPLGNENADSEVLRLARTPLQ